MKKRKLRERLKLVDAILEAHHVRLLKLEQEIDQLREDVKFHATVLRENESTRKEWERWQIPF